MAGKADDGLKLTNARGKVCNDDNDDYAPDKEDDDDNNEPFNDIDTDELQDLHDDAQPKNTQTKSSNKDAPDLSEDEDKEKQQHGTMEDNNADDDDTAGNNNNKVARKMRKLSSDVGPLWSWAAASGAKTKQCSPTWAALMM